MVTADTPTLSPAARARVDAAVETLRGATVERVSWETSGTLDREQQAEAALTATVAALVAEAEARGREAGADGAVRFRIAGTAGDHRAVYVEERGQRDGSQMWAVTRLGAVLASDGFWEHEPLPSSRDDDFLARTRYPSVAAARAAYEQPTPTEGDPR